MMGIPSRLRRTPFAWAAAVMLWSAGIGALHADPPAAASAPPAAGDVPVPQENFLSSLKQAFKQDFDHEVVRGHFDVGMPPDVHRYYCLVDAKTGQRQPNGVSGALAPRPDGMTGIKDAAVSLYSCSSSEQLGSLVTSGYELRGGAAAGATRDVRAEAAPRPTAVQAAATTATATVASALPVAAADKVDVAGLKLGMSPDEVRTILKSKNLRDFRESTGNLGGAPTGKAAASVKATRFVSAISSSSESSGEDGEAFVVLFTPVPGQERVATIVHTVGSQAVALASVIMQAGGIPGDAGHAGGTRHTP
jgi:hypothetical protein